MGKQYVVKLTVEQRADLEARYTGPLTLRQRNRVRALLLADAGDIDTDIADELGIGESTVARLRRRFVEQGLEAALTEKPRCGAPAKFDGKQEAAVIALACSAAPTGHAQWTARLLANRIVELEVAESMSESTARRMLKKTISSRGRSGRGASRR